MRACVRSIPWGARCGRFPPEQVPCPVQTKENRLMPPKKARESGLFLWRDVRGGRHCWMVTLNLTWPEALGEREPLSCQFTPVEVVTDVHPVMALGRGVTQEATGL